jgi:SAM-dependent methyltransferase
MRDIVSGKTLNQIEWTPELSRRFWGDLAGSEFGAEIAFARFAAPFLCDLVSPYLDPAAAVLDFGGGDNLFLVRELLRRGYVVSAYEPNADIAERNRDLQFEPRFRGALGNVPNESFGTIFLSEVIEHLDDDALQGVIGTVTGALRAGGTLVVTTPDRENLFLANRFCPECRSLFHPWGHVRSFDRDQLERLLASFSLQCEALYNVDFSNAREPVQRGEKVAAEVRALAMQMRDAAAASFWGRWRQADRLREAAAALEAIAGPAPDGPANRATIGIGGTLVAVMRKPAAR